MKRTLSFLMSLAVLCMTQPVFAQNGDQLGPLIDGANSVVDELIKWVSGIAGIIVVLMIVIGGLQYMQGNADGGKKTITAAVIGAVIVLLSSAILFAFSNLLHGGEISN